MSGNLPAITGKQLIRLLEHDGWIRGRRSTHGVVFTKRGSDGRTRVTIIPDKADSLPLGTLNDILSSKQTGITRRGLAQLIKRYGID